MPGRVRSAAARAIRRHAAGDPRPAGALFFLVLLAVNRHLLTQPPVLDEAAGLFPAAIYLVRHHFDLLGLFGQPGYWAGGPNVHATSILAPVTALAYAITGAAAPTFVLLHLVHIAIAAWVLAATYAFLRGSTDTLSATLATAALMWFPVFLTQTRYMYLELPLALCALQAMRAYSAGRAAFSAVWATLAAATKESGYAVAACLAFAWLLTPSSGRARARNAVVTLGPTLAFIALQYFYVMPHERTYGAFAVMHFPQHEAIGISTCVALDLRRYLFMAPDLAALVLGALVVGTLRLPAVHRGLRAAPSDARLVRARRFSLAVLWMFGFFAFHHVALPGLGLQCSVLPRYYVALMPLAFFVLAEGLWPMLPPSLVRAGLGTFLAFCVANEDGAFYPSEQHLEGPGVNFAVTERSGAYRHIVAVQREAARRLAALPEELPKFYELEMHYLVHDPWMGYVDRALRQGHNIASEEPYRRGRIEDYPSCFALYYQSPWLGGDVVLRVTKRAMRTPRYRVTPLGRILSGAYQGEFLHVARAGEACPAEPQGFGTILLDR